MHVEQLIKWRGATQQNPSRLKNSEKRFVMIWESPKSAVIAAFIVYSLFAFGHGSPWLPSNTAYFNHLADAFLHGQLSLISVPKVVLDLSYYNGRYFLYWPPLPALILTPFVAIFGVQFSDVIFTVIVAASNVAVVALVLRQSCHQRIIRMSKQRRGILVLFFALGTVHLTLAPFGRVWFTSQVIGFFFVTLAYLFCMSTRGYRAFTLTGLAISAALLTRNHLVLAGVWPAFYLIQQMRSWKLRSQLTHVMAALVPIVISIALLASYNWLRFGNVLENGISYHQMHSAFAADYLKYGYFNIHYVPVNLFYEFVFYPLPPRATTGQGGSLFLLSPVFFGAFWSLKRRSRNLSVLMLITTVALILIPILLLMGTGYFQFGPRYTLDFTLPLLLLTAIGTNDWSISTMFRLTIFSIVQYSIGTLWLSSSL
jgi:hypothetical protein